MSNHNYKYRLHYLLRQLSYNDYQIALKWIPERLNVAISTLKYWIYIKEGDKAEIPLCKLSMLASFFQCSIDDLITKKPAEKSKLFNEFQIFKGHVSNS